MLSADYRKAPTVEPLPTDKPHIGKIINSNEGVSHDEGIVGERKPT
jgi:hypothetical protein